MDYIADEYASIAARMAQIQQERAEAAGLKVEVSVQIKINRTPSPLQAEIYGLTEDGSTKTMTLAETEQAWRKELWQPEEARKLLQQKYEMSRAKLEPAVHAIRVTALPAIGDRVCLVRLPDRERFFLGAAESLVPGEEGTVVERDEAKDLIAVKFAGGAALFLGREHYCRSENAFGASYPANNGPWDRIADPEIERWHQKRMELLMRRKPSEAAIPYDTIQRNIRASHVALIDGKDGPEFSIHAYGLTSRR